MPAIISLEEPRPRGTVLGERTDGRRVGEAYHFSDARRATAGSMGGIWFGFRITRPRCRTQRKIKRNKLRQCFAGPTLMIS
jgi:hypothetical protein